MPDARFSKKCVRRERVEGGEERREGSRDCTQGIGRVAASSERHEGREGLRAGEARQFQGQQKTTR